MMKKLQCVFIILLFIPMLSGCSFMFSQPEVTDYYLLHPLKNTGLAIQPNSKRVAVSIPKSLSRYDTQDILILKESQNVTHLVENQWIERIPAYLQTLLYQSFMNTGKTPNFGRFRDISQPEFIFESEITDFYYIYKTRNEGKVYIRIECFLTHAETNEKTAYKVFEQTLDLKTPLRKRILDKDIIIAFDTAVQNLLHDIVIWVISKA